MRGKYGTHLILKVVLVVACLACRPTDTQQVGQDVKHSNVGSKFANNAAIYYVAPDGNDMNPGNLRYPFKTLEKALEIVKPGETIYVRGGTYHCDKTILFDKSGEEGKPIRVWAYKNEKPEFDFSEAWNEGLLIKVAYWHLRGLIVTGTERAAVCLKSIYAHHNTIEYMTTYGNESSGVLVQSGAADNLILNCDSHHNFDPATNGQNADGMVASFGFGSGNTFRGCRAWNNADDGFDFGPLLSKGVRVESCYAWRNGQNLWNHPLWEGNSNGFKLWRAEIPHILIRCVAWDHAYYGFKVKSGKVYNCTAFQNLAGYSAHMNRSTAKTNVRNNISWPDNNLIRSQVHGEHNSWNEATGLRLTADDFLSTNDSDITGPRNLDGSVPESDFLRLARGSDAIDSGTDVELPYMGKAPDLGAFEYASEAKDTGPSSTSKEEAGEHDAKNTEVDSPLRTAVERGELDAVKRFIAEAGVEGKVLNPLLYIAIDRGDLETAKYLIANGADVNADAPTPVPSKGENYKELCGQLRRGATQENEYRWTPLHAAVSGGNRDIVEYLIAEKADVNTRDDLKWTPLHVAAWQSPDAVTMLIANGTDICAKDFRGRTALHNAAEQGHLNGTKSLIIGGADVHAADNSGSRPLHCAACEGHKDIVELLIANGAEVNSIDNAGRPPLYYAARKGRGSVVVFLVSKGANPNIADKWGWNPVHVAAGAYYEEAMKGLLTTDVDLTLKNNRGRTPLSLARMRCQWLCEMLTDPGRIIHLREAKAVVDLLIEHGAEVEVGDEEQPSKSLHQAAAEGDLEHVKTLLYRGIDFNGRDETGLHTALHLAAMVGHIDVTELLLANGAHVDVRDHCHSTALHNAVEKGYKEIAELLIAKGADIDSKVKSGQTPLHYAAIMGRKDMAELLIEKGANVNVKDENGQTPLHLSVRQGNSEVVNLLVSKGADVNARNKWNRTPLDIAIDQGHTEIVELLRKHLSKE